MTPLIDKNENQIGDMETENVNFTIVASLVVNVIALTFGFVHVTAKLDATRTAKVAKNNVRDIL